MSLRALQVNEVNIQPIQLGDELWEFVEVDLAFTPVVFSLPVGRQLFGVVQRQTLAPILGRLRIGPSRHGQTLGQIV